jgi:SAM-dependent methyltransferase
MSIFKASRMKLPSGANTTFPIANFIRDGVRVVEKKGVYVDREWTASGVTAQFIEDAATYHKHYFDRLDFLGLMERCFKLAGVDHGAALNILDIGSGSGSSVFPTQKLLPGSHIVAADISFQLLEMLAGFVDSHAELKGKITSCCFDLHKPFFRENLFDLVVGSAILHHLIDPYAALRHVAYSLKPGGRIILVEPLEAGSLVQVSMYEKVLVALRNARIENSPIEKLMCALRLDIQARLGVPNVKPWTEHLDDKWVFDEPYLADLTRQLGFSRADVYPAQEDLTAVYETTFRSLLSDSGNRGVEIPDVVLEAVREFDRGISVELKRKLCPTGIIVLTK